MITRIGMSLLLIAMLATPALPQGGCTEYQLWGLSGATGSFTPGYRRSTKDRAGSARGGDFSPPAGLP